MWWVIMNTKTVELTFVKSTKGNTMYTAWSWGSRHAFVVYVLHCQKIHRRYWQALGLEWSKLTPALISWCKYSYGSNPKNCYRTPRWIHLRLVDRLFVALLLSFLWCSFLVSFWIENINLPYAQVAGVLRLMRCMCLRFFGCGKSGWWIDRSFYSVINWCSLS